MEQEKLPFYLVYALKIRRVHYYNMKTKGFFPPKTKKSLKNNFKISTRESFPTPPQR